MKISSYLFLVHLVFSTQGLWAQINFQKTFGNAGSDYSFCVRQTADEGYIIIAYTNGCGIGISGTCMIKTDVNGDSVWTKVYLEGHGNSGQQTSDGGYIIAGQTNSFGSGGFDVYLLKTDSSGNSLWSKTFGGINDDFAYSVQETSDGGYIIAAKTESFGAGNFDVYLIKTDANGDSLWIKTFGGSNIDDGTCVRQTTDGGYILVGNTTSFGAGSADVFLIKTDASGDTLWSKTLGDTSVDIALTGMQTSDGGYMILGYTYSFGAGGMEACLIKTDANGGLAWSKSYGSIDNDVAYYGQQTSDDGYIISGTTNSYGAGNFDVILIKTDLNGDTLWTRSFGGIDNDQGHFVQQTVDTGYIVAGFTQSFGAGNRDIYLLKADNDGHIACNEGGTAITVTSSNIQVAAPAIIVGSTNTIVTTGTAVISSGCLDCSTCTTTDMDEVVVDNSFIIYPNPVQEELFVSWDFEIDNGNIKIYNTFGEIIYSDVVFKKSFKKLDLKHLSAGVYFIRLCEENRTYCKKLIVRDD